MRWEQLGSHITFVPLEPDQWYEIDGFRVKAKFQPQSGDSYGYRFEQDGKAVVYSTDAEHKFASEVEAAAMIDFYRGSDLVIFDAIYSLADMITIKEDWGHSSNTIGVDLYLQAQVKHYCMFHHEPAFDDDMLYTVLQETRRYEEIMREGHILKVSIAYDGLILEV